MKEYLILYIQNLFFFSNLLVCPRAWLWELEIPKYTWVGFVTWGWILGYLGGILH